MPVPDFSPRMLSDEAGFVATAGRLCGLLLFDWHCPLCWSDINPGIIALPNSKIETKNPKYASANSVPVNMTMVELAMDSMAMPRRTNRRLELLRFMIFPLLDGFLLADLGGRI